MIDVNQIQSVSEIMQRVSEIETKLGLRQTARKSSSAAGKTNNAGNTDQNTATARSFDQVLQQELTAGKTAAQSSAGQTTAYGPKSNSTDPAASLAEQEILTAAGNRTAVRTGSEYYNTIRAAAAKYGVDPKLVSAVAEAESDFDQSAVSRAGAIGVMQLMPETAASLGVDPYNATQNIDGGTKYLSQLLRDFGGDVRKAVAAYNAGPQAVKNYGGVPPYSETQNYVNTVLDLYR